MNTRSQTLPILLVALVAAIAVFGVDQLMLAAASGQLDTRLDRTLSAQIATLNERLTGARGLLGGLVATTKVDCSQSSLASRAEIIAARPEIADIAVVDSGGHLQCSSLPVGFRSLEGQGVKPQALDPDETIATGLYGAGEQPVLLLTRRLGVQGGAMVAVIPYAALLTPPRPGADRARYRLSYAGTPVFIPRTTPADATASFETANATFEASAAADDRRFAEQADTDYFPLVLATSVDVSPSITWYDPDRLIADIVAAALVFSIGHIFLIRKREPRRLAAHIDRAIRRNEFEPLYRPIIDLASGRIAAVRVDIVWRSGRRDLSQDEFMTDVISVRHDLKLLRAVLLRSRQNLASAFKLRPRLLLKIAVPFETLLRPQFVDMIRRSMVGSGIRQAQMVICLPAVGEAHDPRHAFDVVKALQSFGIGIELLGSSDAIDFSFETERVVAGAVGLDRRLYAALQAEDEETAARARLWIEQMVEKARPVETRICAYDVPDDDVLRTLRTLGVREAAADRLAPALTATTLMSLVARAGIEWTGSEDDDAEAVAADGDDEPGERRSA